ncbi:MAG: hypothetical protein AAFY99_11435 [Pseudomonadota bacterium]
MGIDDLGSIDRAFRDLYDESRRYFESMNVPAALADLMFSVDPEKVRYLSEDELIFYRLNRRDIIRQEQGDLRTAKRLGVSRVELLQRKQQFEDAFRECWETFDYISDDFNGCVNDATDRYIPHR